MFVLGHLTYCVLALGGMAFIGWACYKGLEGTDEDMYRNQNLRTTVSDKDKSSYDPNAMLVETLRKGGAADLRFDKHEHM